MTEFRNSFLLSITTNQMCTLSKTMLIAENNREQIDVVAALLKVAFEWERDDKLYQ